ncbi:hypothetical protein V8E53_001379 [Lactarius tabidus]
MNAPLTFTHSRITSAQFAGAPRRPRPPSPLLQPHTLPPSTTLESVAASPSPGHSRQPSPLRSRSPFLFPRPQPLPQSRVLDSSGSTQIPDAGISPPSLETAEADIIPPSPVSCQEGHLSQLPTAAAEHLTLDISLPESLGLGQGNARHGNESLRYSSPSLSPNRARPFPLPYSSQVTLHNIPSVDASGNWSDGKKRSIGLMHSEQVSRYVNKGDIPLHLNRLREESKFTLGPMQVNLPKYSQTRRPKGWEPATHPDGAVYFYHAEWKIFTDVYMYDPTLSTEIQAFAIYLERTRTSRLPTNNYDLVLDVIIMEEDEIIWAYYYVDHNSKTLFWQDPYECGDDLLSDVRGVREASHVKLRLESLYWVHWSLYPTCPDRLVRRFPREAPKELLGALLSSGIDSLTSKVSTSPYSVAELESMLGFIKEAENLGEDNPHVISSVARLLSFYAQWRFVHFHGQKSPRLDRFTSIYKDSHRGRTKLFQMFSPILFFSPDTYLRELENVWADKIIVEAMWKEFMQKLVSEWSDFVLYSTVMLTANVSFLAIPGVILVPQDTGTPNAWIKPSPAQITSSVSLVLSIGSIITGLLLIRLNRNMVTKDARRAWYYLEGMSWNRVQFGLEPLAIIFSLTYVLLMWSAWGFFVALLIFSFQNMSRTIWIGVGTAVGIVTVLIVWCIINNWDSGERMNQT